MFSYIRSKYRRFSHVPPSQKDLHNGLSVTQNIFMAPACPPPSCTSQNYNEVVLSTSHSTALPRSDVIETRCGFITPENLIWNPPNLKELGPLRVVGVYNLTPAFWPATIEEMVKTPGINEDVPNSGNNISNLNNQPECTFEELLEDFPTPSPHANEDIFEILGISLDAFDEATEISVITEEEEDNNKLPLSSDHNMEAPANDSTDASALLNFFKLCDPLNAIPQLDYN